MNCIHYTFSIRHIFVLRRVQTYLRQNFSQSLDPSLFIWTIERRHSRCGGAASCLAPLRRRSHSENNTGNPLPQLPVRTRHTAAAAAAEPCDASSALASSVCRHSRSAAATRLASRQLWNGGRALNGARWPLLQLLLRPARVAYDIFSAKSNIKSTEMATLSLLASDGAQSRRKAGQTTASAQRASNGPRSSSKSSNTRKRSSRAASADSTAEKNRDTEHAREKILAHYEEYLWDLQRSDNLYSLTVADLRNVMKQINRPTAGRKEDLIQEVEVWVATRRATTRQQQSSEAYREVGSDEESLEEALLKGESQSRQEEAMSRMTRASLKGAYQREIPAKGTANGDGSEDGGDVKPKPKPSRTAAQRKKASNEDAADEMQQQKKRRRNLEPQHDEEEVASLKTRPSRTKRKAEEQVTGNAKHTAATADTVKGKTRGRREDSAGQKAAGKPLKKALDEPKNSRKKGKAVAADDNDFLVPKSDAAKSKGKSKSKRKSVEVTEDTVLSTAKAVKGRKSKAKSVTVEQETIVSDADGVKSKQRKQSKAKTVVLEQNPLESKQPWTMLIHKKVQDGWVAYNPETMRPAPPQNGARFMKLMSWNVNGLRALIKSKSALIQEAQLLATLATEEEFDVLCLQETKLQEKDVEQIGQTLLSDYESKFWSCSTSKLGYSGTAVISKVKPLSVRYGMGIADHDTEGRLITIEFETFYLLTSYVPNAGDKLVRLAYRTEEWDPALGQYIKDLEKQKPIVLTGDLNCCNEEIDICNPVGNRKSAGFTDEERSSFKANFLNRDLVDTFRDQHPNAVGYTYWGYRTAARPKNQGWRLDYFLVSRSLHEQVHDSYTRPDVLGSDHCPIGLILNLPSA